MSIKFECACGQRIKARDGAEGRWVRCPKCRSKVAVPDGGDPEGSLQMVGGAGLGSGVQAALRWEEQRAGRRDRTPADEGPGRAEQWLMEHGVWVPLGAALMALFAVVGVAAYWAELPTLVQFSAFMFLTGLASYLYGRYDLRRVVGVKDEADRPEGDAPGP